MYIIYHGKGNSILTSLAAAIHLKTFPDNINTYSEFSVFISNFLKLEEISLGRLQPIGYDQENNHIFILTTASAETIILPALTSVFDILQVPKNQLFLVDTTDIEDIRIVIGLWLYKKKLLRKFSERLIYQGVKNQYHKLIKIVERAKIFSRKDK